MSCQDHIIMARDGILDVMSDVFSNPPPPSRSHSSPAAWPFSPRVYAFQRPFREFPGVEYDEVSRCPATIGKPGEWAFARLMYPPVGRYYGGFAVLRVVEGGRLQLDHGLSALRPPLRRGRAPPDPRPRALRRAAGESRRGRCLRLAVALRRRSRATGISPTSRRKTCANTCCAAASSCATISTARIEWEVFAASMQKVFPDRPIVDIPNNDADLPHPLRSGRPLPGARRAVRWKPATPTKKARPARRRTGAASTTTTAA